MSKKWMSAAAGFGVATMMFGAVAMAQTPPPATTVTPVATVGGTVTAVMTGTMGTTATVVATGTQTISGTQTVVAGTPNPAGTVVAGTPGATAVISGNIYQAGGTGNFPFADPAFKQTWNRIDGPVKNGLVNRTYYWGPGPNSIGLLEPYAQGPGGQHLVQYFDKSRMELNNPNAPRQSPFFVTNGLLAVDMIAGSVQVGDNTFTTFHPACIPMSGDFGDTMAPTYASFQKVSVSGDRVDTHQAKNRTGEKITQTIDRDGTVGNDPSKANIPNVQVAQYITETQHNIPAAFWTFLNSSGPVYDNNNKVVNEQLSQPYFYVTGLPISEAYWAKATIKGKITDVMIQAFERRALTYVPTNPSGFQVEMANIGQHYFDWRYRGGGYCAGTPQVSPTPPQPVPSGTVVSGTPGTTATVVGTVTAVGTGTAVSTGTVVGTVVGTVTAVSSTTVVPVPSGTVVVGTATGTVVPGVTPVGTRVP